MLKSVRSRAEEQFAASQKKLKPVRKEKDKAGQDRAEKVARLRALRLAKETSYKEAADKIDVEKRTNNRRVSIEDSKT